MKPCNFPERVNQRRKNALERNLLNDHEKPQNLMTIENTRKKISESSLRQVKTKKLRSDKRRLF